jgi:hypothetical protein
MKAAHEAVTYRDWLESRVDASRAGLIDGVNQGTLEKEWERVRAAKLKQRAAGKA